MKAPTSGMTDMAMVTAGRFTPEAASLPTQMRTRLAVIAPLCLLACTILAWSVAHGRAPYGFEDPALTWLGPSSARGTWADLATLLVAPMVGGVLLVSVVLGLVRRVVRRVAVYALLAVAALVISEFIVKPLVHRVYDTELTFPSGHVTAVSGTALAMWLALYPLFGQRARILMLAFGVAWTLLISLAVIGAHWHTPLDVVGAILLSVGIVAAGAVAFESVGTPRPSMNTVRTPSAQRSGRRIHL